MKNKQELSLSVYKAIVKQSPTEGRFLEECKCGKRGTYIKLDQTVATGKISQCFREKQREVKSTLTAKNVNQNVSMERQVLEDYVSVRIDYID
jgi:NurA-like 5'-3' nuclease